MGQHLEGKVTDVFWRVCRGYPVSSYLCVYLLCVVAEVCLATLLCLPKACCHPSAINRSLVHFHPEVWFGWIKHGTFYCVSPVLCVQKIFTWTVLPCGALSSDADPMRVGFLQQVFRSGRWSATFLLQIEILIANVWWPFGKCLWPWMNPDELWR